MRNIGVIKMRENLKKARQEAGINLSKEDKEQLIADLRQLSKSVTLVCCTLIGILKDFCDEYPEQYPKRRFDYAR